MSPNRVNPSPWTWQQWTKVVGLVFGVQLALTLVLSRRAEPLTVIRAARTEFQVTWSADASRGASQALLSEDPAGFALVTPKGFTGVLWLEQPRLETGLVDLPLPVTVDARSRSSAPEIDPAPWRVGATVPPRAEDPRPAADFTRAGLSDEALIAGSTVRLEAGLAERGLRRVPDLPQWTNSEVLLPSVVEVLVDGEGGVVAAWPAVSPSPTGTPHRGSGLAAADQAALALARELWFGARPEVPTEWGRVAFVWRTMMPAAAPERAVGAPP